VNESWWAQASGEGWAFLNKTLQYLLVCLFLQLRYTNNANISRCNFPQK